MLGWDHIRVDFNGLKPNDLERLLARLPRNATLEVGIAIDETSGVSPNIVELLNRHSEQVSALILKDAKRPLPTATGVTRVRAALQGSPASRIPVLASPTGYFVELNRNELFELDVDGIAFPVSSTVHVDDAGTILENTSTVGDMIATARRLTGKPRIAISPLALYLQKPESNRFPPALIAPWLTSIVALAAEAGVISITLSEDVVEGLVRTDMKTP